MKLLDAVPVLVGIALAILCYFLSGVVPKEASSGLLLLAGALAGWSIPRLSDLGKKAASMLLLVGALSQASCHNVKPDQFFGAAVDCAKVNPSASAALAQVQTCLLGTLAGNPEVCLAGLVAEVHFTVDEVACVVAWVAQQENQKVAASKATLYDLKVRDNAARWLAAKQIVIRNSYKGACAQ